MQAVWRASADQGGFCRTVRLLMLSGQRRSDFSFPPDKGDTPISGWTRLRKKLDVTVRGEMTGPEAEDWRVARATGALRPDTRAHKWAALARITGTPTTP